MDRVREHPGGGRGRPRHGGRVGAAAGGSLSDAASGHVWRWTLAALTAISAAFLLFSLREVLNPFLLLLALWGFSAPLRDAPGYTAAFGTATALTTFWLLSTTGTLLAPFVLALVLAYVLDPAVDRIVARGIPRSAAIALLTLPAVALLAVLVFVALPEALGELARVGQRVPDLVRQAAVWLEAAGPRLGNFDVPFVDERAWLERARNVDAAAVAAFLDGRGEVLWGWFWGGVLGMGRGFGAALGALGFVFLTPVLTFYLLRDWDRLTAALGDLVPHHRRESVTGFAREYDRLLARYFRGQVIVSASVGALTAAGLWIAHFPYAATLGLLVAVFGVVPYLGLALSLIPAVAIALLSGSVGVSLLKVAVVYGTAQALEGAFISPRVVGDAVGLHPVLVVLALSLGGYFFGPVGLLLAVPAAVGARLVVLRGLARYRSSAGYGGDEVPGDA